MFAIITTLPGAVRQRETRKGARLSSLLGGFNMTPPACLPPTQLVLSPIKRPDTGAWQHGPRRSTGSLHHWSSAYGTIHIIQFDQTCVLCLLDNVNALSKAGEVGSYTGSWYPCGEHSCKCPTHPCIKADKQACLSSQFSIGITERLEAVLCTG